VSQSGRTFNHAIYSNLVSPGVRQAKPSFLPTSKALKRYGVSTSKVHRYGIISLYLIQGNRKTSTLDVVFVQPFIKADTSTLFR